ncbi:hypothetical protein OOK48_16200 [Streptomyces viridodiastaticus]|nr:hypothetical protein [Streptomyces viridodiastaticus]MCX4567869.1 hypothetical protein [Streptomyces viridodiastaticus]
MNVLTELLAGVAHLVGRLVRRAGGGRLDAVSRRPPRAYAGAG